MDVGAVILAGGKSSRMGENKALLPINGLTNIERIKNILAEQFEDIILVANDQTPYEFLKLPIVNDLVREKGPLAGIQAGLLKAKHEANVFVACDMPFLSKDVINVLIDNSEGYDAVVPIISGVRHPLFALYKKSVLKYLNDCLSNEKLRIKHLLDGIKVNYVDESHFEAADLETVFFNMNDKMQYEEAKRLAKNN